MSFRKGSLNFLLCSPRAVFVARGSHPDCCWQGATDRPTITSHSKRKRKEDPQLLTAERGFCYLLLFAPSLGSALWPLVPCKKGRRKHPLSKGIEVMPARPGGAYSCRKSSWNQLPPADNWREAGDSGTSCRPHQNRLNRFRAGWPIPPDQISLNNLSSLGIHQKGRHHYPHLALAQENTFVSPQPCQKTRTPIWSGQHNQQVPKALMGTREAWQEAAIFISGNANPSSKAGQRQSGKHSRPGFKTTSSPGELPGWCPSRWEERRPSSPSPSSQKWLGKAGRRGGRGGQASGFGTLDHWGGERGGAKTSCSRLIFSGGAGQEQPGL